MFSSILPSVSSSLKFGQSGSSKQNRFSVRVFKAPDNAPYSYSTSPPKFMDMGYRPMPHQEQVPPNWYPNNTISPQYAPPARSTYGIYPHAANNAYIYEQSLESKSDLYSTSDYDTLSITTASAFSPAFSIDSTMALKSPATTEHPMEIPRGPRSATPGVRSAYPSAPPMQAPSMSRTPSGRYMPDPYLSAPMQMRGAPSYGPGMPPMTAIPQMMAPAGYPIQLPEYDPSTISEIEVEERDKIAKINAEYNAASSASYHSTSTSSSPELKGSAGGIRRAPSSSPPKTPSQRDISSRTPSSQPLHPDLHFPPQRKSSRDEKDYSSSSYQDRGSFKLPINASRDGSPPSVERVSSQLPPEDEPLVRTPTQPLDTRSTPGYDNWSREATPNSERIPAPPNARHPPSTAPVTPPEGRQSSNSPPTSRYSIYAPNPQDLGPSYEQRQAPYPTGPPSFPTRQRKSSMVGSNGAFGSASRSGSETSPYETPRVPSDYRESEGRPSKTSTDVPLSTPRDYFPSGYSSSSEARRDYFSSGPAPQGPAIHYQIPAPERSSPSNRSPPSSESRRDARTTASQPQDQDRSYDSEEQYQQYPSKRPSPPSRRQSYIQSPSDPSPRSSKDRYSPEGRENILQSGPLTSSLKDIKDEPTAFGGALNPSYADRSSDYNKVRERSTSFSKSARPDLPPTAPTSAYPRQAFDYPDSRYPSDYDRDGDRSREMDRDRDRDRDRRRRDRSGTITSERTSPSGSRSSDEGHYQKPYNAPNSFDDRREEQRGSYSTPPTPLNPTPPQGYPSRDRDSERDRPPQTYPQRRAATVETASSSSSSSRSPDSQSSRKSMAVETPTPQPPAYSPPHPELHRRQSDGDKQPYDISNVLPPSVTSQYEKRPPSSASSKSSSSSTSSMPLPIPPPEPQRRYSDGDQNPISIRPPTSGRNSVPLSRSVRWNENLVAPSPILAPQRRKGWYNRRGDQLWTNDGGYRPPVSGQDYPPDLDEYPDHSEGWMNEEGIRIDLSHRLVPKVPLRSALKTFVTKA